MKRSITGKKIIAAATLATLALSSTAAFASNNVQQNVNDPKNEIVQQIEKTDTKTPIKHVVVLFQENVSFDHYYGTYPNAKNPAGEPQFKAAPNTPKVNGLNDNLLNHNPNQFNPKRLDRSQAMTADMD